MGTFEKDTVIVATDCDLYAVVDYVSGSRILGYVYRQGKLQHRIARTLNDFMVDHPFTLSTNTEFKDKYPEYFI